MKKMLSLILAGAALFAGLSSSGMAEDVFGEEVIYRIESRDAETGDRLVFHLGPFSRRIEESELSRLSRQYLDYNAREDGFRPDASCTVRAETDPQTIHNILTAPLRVAEKENLVLETALREQKERVEQLERENAVLAFENGNLKRALEDKD